MLDGYNDLKEDDIIECFEIEEVAATLYSLCTECTPELPNPWHSERHARWSDARRLELVRCPGRAVAQGQAAGGAVVQGAGEVALSCLDRRGRPSRQAAARDLRRGGGLRRRRGMRGVARSGLVDGEHAPQRAPDRSRERDHSVRRRWVGGARRHRAAGAGRRQRTTRSEMHAGNVKRSARVAERVREEIAMALARDLEDPRLDHVVVTRVEMPDDLQLARVRCVSPTGGDDPARRQRALAGLAAAAAPCATRWPGARVCGARQSSSSSTTRVKTAARGWRSCSRRSGRIDPTRSRYAAHAVESDASRASRKRGRTCGAAGLRRRSGRVATCGAAGLRRAEAAGCGRADAGELRACECR